MKSQNKLKGLFLILTVALVLAMIIPVSADQLILNPNGAGDETNLDPTPDVDNWLNVSDNDDNSFVATASAPWSADLYNLEDSVGSGTINWVQIIVRAKAGSDTPDLNSLKTYIMIGGTSYEDEGTAQLLTGSYTEYYSAEYLYKPDTVSDPWTWDDIDALQAGVILTKSRTSSAGGNPPWSRCSKVWVVVDYTPDSSGFEGKSHGYWKNQGYKNEEWYTYSPEETLGDVFDLDGWDDLESVTLYDALFFDGGPTLEEKAQILLRNAVASLLNAEHPKINYPLTSQEIINEVNDALDSGDADIILELEATLDEYNNLGADLGS